MDTVESQTDHSVGQTEVKGSLFDNIVCYDQNNRLSKVPLPWWN